MPGRTLGPMDRGCGRGELSQNTVLMCLETQDPNAHKQGNVCERQQFTLSMKLSRDWYCTAKARKVAGVCVKRITVAQFAQTSYSDCRGHGPNRPRQLPHVTRATVYRDSMLLKSQRRRILGADGWQPKSLLNSIWQGKPACWRNPEYSDLSRETSRSS